MTTPTPPGFLPPHGQPVYGPSARGYVPPGTGFGPSQNYGSAQPYVPQQGYGPPVPQQGFGPGPYGAAEPPAPPRRRPVGLLVAGVVGAVVVSLLVLGAVFGSSSGMNVESALQDALQGRPGITSVSDVSCPSSVDTDKGSTTTCQATVNGQRSNLTLSFDADEHFVVTDAVPVG